MVTVEKAIIARMDKGGKHFEVLVDPDLAYDFRSGKSISVGKLIAANFVFTDARKADRAGPADLQKAFGTTDIEKITEKIVKEGDLQLTTEFRRKKIEEKRKQIASLISRAAIDPHSKLPHPPERIINAMDQAHINIDPFKPAEQQIDDVLKAIKSILPISIEEISIIAEVPINYASRVKGAIKEYGQAQEQWLGNKFVIKIKIPAGLKEKFYTHMNGLTEGSAKISEEK